MLCLFFSPAYIRSNQIMGWGEKAIEIRSVETGHLDGVFMHKRAQRLKFLCERNDKVSVRSASVSLKLGNALKLQRLWELYFFLRGFSSAVKKKILGEFRFN